MATKTTEKKSTSKKTAATDPMPALADEVLTTLLHRALVRLGEPTRVTEIVRELDDESVTVGLARHALESHPRRFVAVDRRWDLAQRYFDKQRPVARALEELVALYGGAMPTAEVPGELAQIYGRVKEHFDEVAPRLLRGPRFFPIRSGRAFGLRSWLLNTESVSEADLLFYNYLQAETLAPLAKVAANLDWANDPVGAARQVLAATGGLTVDNRLLQYLAFKALPADDFDAVALYDTLASGDAFVGLPDHRWLATDTLEAVRAQWRAQAEIVGDGPTEEPVAEVVAVETAAKPLEVTEDDLAELRRYFEDREDIATSPQLLTDVLEVRAGSRTFAEDTQTLTAFLRSKPEDFLWVGAERFRAPGTLPPYIGQLPESLTFPTLPRFETADGEILDQMLDDEAYEDGLGDEILDPVAQDVNDQEPDGVTRWPGSVGPNSPRLRLVLKSHHKEIGTFPLSQVPFGFFPTEPNIVELTLRDAAGNAYPIYVDYDVQLVYGLFDVYSEIAADSGAVFILEKTDKPDEYKFTLDNETDPGVFIGPARMDDLIEYRSEVEGGPAVSTYDIMRRILDHYRKGCSFLTLLTEVNLVRRTPRRLLASILSGYAAFHPRANRWTFDAKKEPEGFDRTKTPFIKRGRGIGGRPKRAAPRFVSMNFLAHYVLATRFLTPPAPLPFYVVGTALPDLLPLADRHRRLRPAVLALSPDATPEERALRAGAQAHLATDAAFHKTAAFADAQTQIGILVQQAGFTDMRVRRFFLAHVLVELALDAVLLRREPDLVNDFYGAFTSAPLPPVVAWAEATLGAPLLRLPGVLTRFALSRYLRSYADDDGVAEGLSRVSVKARQDPFEGDNRLRLVRLVSQAVPVVAALTPSLLDQTATGIPPHPPTTEK